MSELIPYRPLARDDFRSSEPTGLAIPEEEKVAAATCLKIIVRPGEVVTRGGGEQFVASLDQPIFFAALGRRCSWWSSGEELAEAQVVEHEQIHFAIAEL